MAETINADLARWLHRGYGVRLESLEFPPPGERLYVRRGEFCQVLFAAVERL